MVAVGKLIVEQNKIGFAVECLYEFDDLTFPIDSENGVAEVDSPGLEDFETMIWKELGVVVKYKILEVCALEVTKDKIHSKYEDWRYYWKRNYLPMLKV